MRTVGPVLAACVLAGLLANLAACGHGGQRRDAATTGPGQDAAVTAPGTRKDAAVSAPSTPPDAAQSGRPDAGNAEPDTGAANPPEVDASVPTTCDPECAAGERCELMQVTCVRAPCPPIPTCVKLEPVSCDPRLILCRRAPPECPQWHVPSVSGSCFGPCVPVEQCACDEPADCPDPDHFTCHRSAAHCGPYVQ